MNTPSTRRFDLDWMRVIGILAVFIFHSTRFFSLDDWHVKNGSISLFPQDMEQFMNLWLMPFMFVISGASLYFALGKGKGWSGVGSFIKDKVLRLLVPVVVNAVSLIILPVYLERVSHNQFVGSFLDFLPHYFEGIYAFGGNFAVIPLHLWYLEVLFVFSLVTLPVFILLKSRIGAKVLGWVTTAAALPGGIYVMALLTIVSWKLIDPSGILGFDKFNWNLGVYLSYFVYGFIVISNAKLQNSLKSHRWFSLVIALAATYWWMSSGGEHDDVASITWILTFLGFGMRYLNADTRAVKYAGEAVLPFYILHQTVLLAVGYIVVQWAIPDLLKWAIITVVSLAIILGLYEGLIRRINILRFLFGMRLVKKAPQPVAQSLQPALR